MLKKLSLLSMLTLTTLADTTYGSDDESYDTESDIEMYMPRVPIPAPTCPPAPRKVRVNPQREGNPNTPRQLDFSGNAN